MVLEFAVPYLCLLYMQKRWGCIDRVKEAPKDFNIYSYGIWTGKTHLVLVRTSDPRTHVADGILPGSHTSPSLGGYPFANIYIRPSTVERLGIRLYP